MNSSSGTLVVSQTESENLYNRSESSTDKISFETATPMPHASGRGPRGGDRHGPNHTSSAALSVKSSELTSSIPTGVMGRATAIARTRATEKLFVKSVFKWKWEKFIIVLCCKR